MRPLEGVSIPARQRKIMLLPAPEPPNNPKGCSSEVKATFKSKLVKIFSMLTNNPPEFKARFGI